MSETVTISKERYAELLDAEFWVQCLESAGVDNWCGYDYAQEEYQQGQDGDDSE